VDIVPTSPNPGKPFIIIGLFGLLVSLIIHKHLKNLIKILFILFNKNLSVFSIFAKTINYINASKTLCFMTVCHKRDEVVKRGRNRKIRPKTFKSEQAAAAYAKLKKIDSYVLKNIKNPEAKGKKIIIVKND
jgi:hypothetical protein